MFKLNCSSFCSLVLRILYIFWTQTLVRCKICKYFLPFCRLSFVLLIMTFDIWTFITNACSAFLFSLLLLTLLVSYQRTHYWSTPMLPSDGLMVSVIIFRLLIHLVLIIIYGIKRPTSFFQMWKFHCSDIIYWKVYSSLIE